MGVGPLSGRFVQGGVGWRVMGLWPCFHPSLSLGMCDWCIALVIGCMDWGVLCCCGLSLAAGVVWFGCLCRECVILVGNGG